MSAMSMSLRSVAQHERSHKGNVELAGIIDTAADEIDRLNNVLGAYTRSFGEFERTISWLNEQLRSRTEQNRG